MVPKYVSQNSVAVSKNRGGNFTLCKLLAAPYLFCCRFFKDWIVSQCQCGGIVTSKDDKHWYRLNPVADCWQKKGYHGSPLWIGDDDD